MQRGMLQGSLKAWFYDQLENQEQHSEEKNHDRDLVDPVHHAQIDVRRTIRILLSKEISSHLAKTEEFFPSAAGFLLSFNVRFFLFVHNYFGG
jgi:hypothetical protein